MMIEFSLTRFSYEIHSKSRTFWPYKIELIGEDENEERQFFRIAENKTLSPPKFHPCFSKKRIIIPSEKNV